MTASVMGLHRSRTIEAVAARTSQRLTFAPGQMGRRIRRARPAVTRDVASLFGLARLVELDEPKIRRLEFDYESETVYIDIMGESRLHYKVQIGLRDYIKNYGTCLPLGVGCGGQAVPTRHQIQGGYRWSRG